MITGFDFIYKYVVDNGLIDVIVEFALYDIPVGIYSDRIVIFGLRTEF